MNRSEILQSVNSTLLVNTNVGKKRFFATSVLRCSSTHERTGYLFELDWAKKIILKKIPIPIETNSPFWNSRGGNRGGRGICYFEGYLYVATAMSLLKYDESLNMVGEISNPYFGGIHEIFNDDTGIWITSTIHDIILKVSYNGDILYKWEASNSEVLQNYFKFEPRTLNIGLRFPQSSFVEYYEKYCREEVFHLNSVFVHNDEVYTLSSKRKAFIKIFPKEEVIFVDKDLGQPHNGIIHNNSIVVNDTQNQCLRLYNLNTRERIRTIPTFIFENKNKSILFAKAGWQRGFTQICENIFLVGTAPATLFEVDIESGEIGQICYIDDDVNHTINGLLVV